MTEDAAVVLGGLVARSLTGSELRVVGASPGEVIAGLGAVGWDATRIARLRDDCIAAGQRWPLPIPARERGDVGAAQLVAATQSVVELLGLGPETRLRDQDVPLSARDQALIADRPPHHGS